MLPILLWYSDIDGPVKRKAARNIEDECRWRGLGPSDLLDLPPTYELTVDQDPCLPDRFLDLQNSDGVHEHGKIQDSQRVVLKQTRQEGPRGARMK